MPAQSKVLQGTFRKDRDSHGPGNTNIGVPECPAEAPKCVRLAWKKIAPELERQGLLSTADQVPLFAYLDSYTKFMMVTKTIESFDDMMEKTPNDYMQMSQAFHLRSKLWKEVMEGAREFGQTPASRSSLKAPAQGQMQLDGFEEL